MAEKLTFTTSLCADIKDGNFSDEFLGHLSEAPLTREQVLAAIAEAAENAADRKDKQAGIVAKSVKGFEDLAGGAEFETNRALSLRDLAKKLRS